MTPKMIRSQLAGLVKLDMGRVREFIDAILESDRQAPRKQRHTAHRIYQRLRMELPGGDASESTVRRYVGRRKRAMGLAGRETFVPQSYAWGSEAQVDWYEAYADLGGERQKLQVFSLRSMASGAAFHRAYPRATQQAFLEAHELAFRYLGGVFPLRRYDNLTLAVKKILRGHRREETTCFVAFRSHGGFQTEFCTPGAAHAKGGVEGEGGYFRRNHWVPVPPARDLADRNEQLRAACRQDEQRPLAGREQTVGAALPAEREQLQPLARQSFALEEVSFPTVDGSGCVRVRTNFYSVPVRAGTAVPAKVYPAHVERWPEGKCVAPHARGDRRQQPILDLEHYLEVLERKPGALAGSKPLEQWRKLGRWPASYAGCWAALMRRQGKQGETRQMIGLLQLGKRQSYAKLQAAVESALALGCWDEAAVRYLLLTESEHRPPQQGSAEFVSF